MNQLPMAMHVENRNDYSYSLKGIYKIRRPPLYCENYFYLYID